VMDTHLKAVNDVVIMTSYYGWHKSARIYVFKSVDVTPKNDI
jgi:hypothetical protein